MKEPIWLLPEAVIALQEALVAEFGGDAGLRDSAMLDSALARPLQRYNYDPATDPFELAAAYAFGLARNHPFIDGNKRIAFVASVLFLESNGQTFAASQVDAVVQTLGLAAGAVSETEYAAWFRANSKQADR